MNQEEMKSKLEEAMKDETFVKELEEAPDVETAQKIFKSKGFEFTTEELEAIANQIRSSNDEIAEDQLETVSGGLLLPLHNPLIVYAIAKVVKRLVKW